MARELDHFELPIWSAPLPRRRQGGGRQLDRERRLHGEALIEQATTLVERFQRERSEPSHIDPRLIFRLRLHPSASLDESHVEALGLRVLGRSTPPS